MAEKRLGIFTRLFVLTVGFAILVLITITAFNWQSPPFEIYMLGYDVSVYALALLVILFGLAGASLVKTGLLGKWRLD